MPTRLLLVFVAVLAAVAAQSLDDVDIYSGDSLMPGYMPWLVSLVAEVSSEPGAEFRRQQRLQSGLPPTPTNLTLEFLCAGSLIASEYVLTAAHCAALLNETQAQGGVLSAIVNTTIWNAGGDALDIEAMWIHPGFDPLANVQTADVAVLKLKGAAHPDIKPLPLVTESFAPKLEANGTPAEFAGWGQTKSNPYPLVASLATRLLVVEVNTCQKLLDAFPWPQWFHKLQVVEQNICAYDFVDSQFAKQSACHGDSGGPLVVRSQGQPFQVGILSQGTGFCGEFLNATAPDVYMRASLFVPWIQNVTNNALQPVTLPLPPSIIADV